MKGASMVYLIVFVLFLSMKWVSPAKTAGEEYLDAMEAQVTRLQQQVQNNSFHQCDLLASCTPAMCSRRSCWPLVDDVQRSTCQKVQNNSYCAAPAAGTCPSKKFDYTKPYVRISNTTDWTSTETATTICAQRQLSTVFKDICNSSSHSRVFFGSVDGTYMHFPGSDQSAEECDSYDPRIRPWYCTSASVTKAVMVLLDVGESMGRSVPYPLEGSIFNVSQTIALALLNTLSTQDYVNIITFNSISTTTLASSPVKVLLDNFGSSASPDLDWLKANLTSLKNGNLEGNGQQSSNISLGIDEALRNYGLLQSQSSAMEIIVVFTDGGAKKLKDGALAALVGRNKTKVFIFKLPQPNDANQFLNETPAFFAQLHNIGGSFNAITSKVALNPLYSILPYFSFLANVRANINSSADYSSIYEDFEHIVNKVFSITKPVFDENQTLLGVVGQNIFVEELGTLTGSVSEAVQSRTMSKTFDPTKVKFTANIQDASPAPLCPSIPTPSTLGLCPKTDNISTIQNLTCCNACSALTPPNSAPADSAPPNSTPKYIAIGVSSGVFALVVFVFVLVCRRGFPCCRKQTQVDLSKYPGSPECSKLKPSSEIHNEGL